MKKIMVIDDSALMRRVMSDIIYNTKEYIVAYTASNGLEGLEILKKNDDILAVLCDINMPKMGGIELLKKIKELEIDVPFIMISSIQDTHDTMLALDLGSLEFIKKPEQIFDRNNEEYNRKILNSLKMAEEVRDRSRKKSNIVSSVSKIKKDKAIETKQRPVEIKGTKRSNVSIDSKNKLIALVCSTGGPKALQRVIPKLPANLPVPMILVQHMPAGFTATMAQRLDSMSKVKVKEASDGEKLEAGVVYIAKGGTHMAVSSGRIQFDDAPPVVGLKPCGNIMYKSLVDSNYDEIVCVVLTGMGADGTKGIKELAKTKNIYVIAQDEDSSTVYGMPKAIYESGLCDCVCDLDEIANQIVKKVGV